MNDVIDVICTLLLRKYLSINAVYEYTVPCVDKHENLKGVERVKVHLKAQLTMGYTRYK